MKGIIKRMLLSFSISAMSGLLVNLIIDSAMNAGGNEGFIAISPDFRALFPTPAIAAYVNILLYGLIGAVFAGMTFIFETSRIGFLIQWLIYFLVTESVCLGVTVLLWQLHHHPQALIYTLVGYGVTYVILGITQYRKLKKEVEEINLTLADER